MATENTEFTEEKQRVAQRSPPHLNGALGAMRFSVCSVTSVARTAVFRLNFQEFTTGDQLLNTSPITAII